ncbi:hypothetical protein DPMN_157588 [Dreissena polymorpha]|uniref:Uncharacterized protein n=1 Tax=Dreissena polymorpha TaxID=45954 RepID=A0A9D4IP00_DREPO|nr:hypothetical protein DPMN_157588 [Dreissena polymorpha]
MPRKSAPHLLHEAQDQRVNTERYLTFVGPEKPLQATVNEERLYGLDKSTGTTLCVRLFSRAC